MYGRDGASTEQAFPCICMVEMERPLNVVEYTLGPGLDLEYETEPQSSAPEPAMYETAYVTSHKVCTSRSSLTCTVTCII